MFRTTHAKVPAIPVLREACWTSQVNGCRHCRVAPPLSPACWTSLIKESFCCDLETGALFAPSLYGLWASLLRSSQLFKSMFQAASDVRKVQARVVPQEHLKRSTAVRRSSASPPRPRSTELAAPKAKSPAASQHEQEDLLEAWHRECRVLGPAVVVP